MIWFILLISAIVRLWGINFAFPLRYGHIDESVIIFYTTRFLTGDLNPNPFFDYPTLFLYLLLICYLIFFITGFAFGKFGSMENFIAYNISNPVPFILIGRILTVLFSLATIYLVYLFAKKLFDKKTGLLSALFLSLSWQHILNSHYATTDIAAAFFTLLSVYFVWELYTNPAPLKTSEVSTPKNNNVIRNNNNKNIVIGQWSGIKSYIFAGLFCGLSIATKYYGGIIFLAVIIFGRGNLKYLGISLASMILGFFIGCPYAFIDYTGFISRFLDRFDLIIGWGKNINIMSTNVLYIKTFMYGLGFFLTITTLIGIIFLIVNRNKQNIFLLTITLILLIFFATWRNPAGRYYLALYPFFAIISGVTIVKIKKKLSLTAVLVVFLITVLPKIVKTDVLLSQKDTRVIAREWVLKNIPAASRILRGPFCPEFPNDKYNVTIDWHNEVKLKDFSELQKEYDYIITSSLYSDSKLFSDTLEKNGEIVYEAPRVENPWYLLFQDSTERNPARRPFIHALTGMVFWMQDEISKDSMGEFQNPTIKIYKL
ncbi:MAG TPA: hypothetical protein DCP53_02380 [Elusimicrobia bacterium]|nr:MAG: hypothetical protein A2551_02260 [Elusimicrobia bacterium RIFOXYD2_FULL_34_30]HAM38235.1 hypothetical protein [Elusimicrobiota bacterium]